MVKILVPTDYSSCSVAALKHAAALARGSKGSLLVLRVVESGSDPVENQSVDAQDPLFHDVALLLESFSQGAPPLEYEERRVEGVPVEAILSTARQEKVDLIVMGTTGRTGLRRVLLGSVAEEVCRKAPCPVLVLKADQQQPTVETTDEFWDRLTGVETQSAPGVPQDVLTSAEINENPTYALLSRAIAARATDVHIDPTGHEFYVRIRVDGLLINYCQLSHEVGHALMTQLKVMANFDITDHFHAQEGRLILPESLQSYEVRITSAPVIDGEAISLRLLSRDRLMRPMDQLGLSVQSRRAIEQILSHREGIVLVTGPTGSGKTTTLYSMLRALDDGRRNIVSIEDPVEYNIPTFRQMPVDPRHGITMTSGLRTLLRLDPDIVLVGEIRDGETAETAMRAASSGKYVFSSLHTRDVASTVTALRDLRIDNRSLAGNLTGIISQRLVRRLCPHCARSEKPTEREAALFLSHGMQPPAKIRHPVGCAFCRRTGYHERIGVFEVVTSDFGLMNAIEDGDSEAELRRLIHSHGICSLQRDGLHKVAEGLTSLEELASISELSCATLVNDAESPTVAQNIAPESIYCRADLEPSLDHADSELVAVGETSQERGTK